MKRTQFAAIVLPLILLSAPVLSQSLAQSLPPQDKLLREIYQELIEINTTDSVGNCTHAANAMAARLETGGYTDAEMQLIIPPDGLKKGNLVARLKDTGAKKPFMLFAHIDVVEAKREDWARDPFKLVEEGGASDYCRPGFSPGPNFSAGSSNPNLRLVPVGHRVLRSASWRLH